MKTLIAAVLCCEEHLDAPKLLVSPGLTIKPLLLCNAGGVAVMFALACRCVSQGSHHDQACLFGSGRKLTFMREAGDLRGFAHEPGFLTARMP